MKWFFVASVLLVGAVWGKDENKLQKVDSSSSSEEGPDQAMMMLAAFREYLQTKCEQNGGKDAWHKLESGMEELINCMDAFVKPENITLRLKQMQSSEETDFDLEKECKEVSPKIRTCIQPIVHKLEVCADPGEKWMPQFVFDVMDSIDHYLCHSGTEQIKKLFEGDGLDCIMHLMDLPDNVPNTCEEQISEAKKSNDDNIFTKTEVCGNLHDMETCALSFVERQCPKSKSMKVAVEGMLEAIQVPCKSKH